jgi:mRNA interferase RelE/StbE
LPWTTEVSNSAERALRKLDRHTARRISTFIDTRLNGIEDPRQIGKALHASLKNYWSYRVGDYRLLCELHDDRIVILIVEIGHRSDVYR